MAQTEVKKKTNSKITDMVYIGLSAAIIAVCSWISIPLTVPITLQTMGVVLISGLFGAKREHSQPSFISSSVQSVFLFFQDLRADSASFSVQRADT